MKPCLMGLKELALKRTTSCDCQMDTCSRGVEGDTAPRSLGRPFSGINLPAYVTRKSLSVSDRSSLYLFDLAEALYSVQSIEFGITVRASKPMLLSQDSPLSETEQPIGLLDLIRRLLIVS